MQRDPQGVLNTTSNIRGSPYPDYAHDPLQVPVQSQVMPLEEGVANSTVQSLCT